MTRTRRNLAMLLALPILLSQVACASATGNGALIGGAGGGAIGALIGKATGSPARGAILGAAVGATAGAVIGSELDRQAEDLDARLQHAQIERRGEETRVLFDAGIFFDFDSAELTPLARRSIEVLAECLVNYPGYDVRVVGHTDEVGSDAYNQTLSERRAESARTYLMLSGVRPSRIAAWGMGESQPVASNATEAGRQQNRRVEVSISASDDYRRELQRRR